MASVHDVTSIYKEGWWGKELWRSDSAAELRGGSRCSRKWNEKRDPVQGSVIGGDLEGDRLGLKEGSMCPGEEGESMAWGWNTPERAREWKVLIKACLRLEELSWDGVGPEPKRALQGQCSACSEKRGIDRYLSRWMMGINCKSVFKCRWWRWT